jgi:outer membrane protein OmpA-like peptidoglycan-associated protein
MRFLNLIFSLFTVYCLAQNDTLIYAVGKITNSVTKEPVDAKIFYESLPYGSKVGFLNGSEFSFPLYENLRYSITVDAPGFAQAKYLLDPGDANEERRVVQDIALKIPGNAGDSVAHHAGAVRRLNVLFDANKYEILPVSFGELDALAYTMKNNPTMIIQLEGHTDPQGDARKQMKLSKNRVEAVKKYLILRDVSGSRIKTVAFGGTQPISTAKTAEAHRLNRRVEMRVLEN